MLKVASTNGEVEGMWLKAEKKKSCVKQPSVNDVDTTIAGKGPVVS